MSLSTLLRGAAVGITLVALVAPTAAHAGKSVHRDATGDVVSATFDPETETEEVTPAPHQKRGDITRSVAHHRAQRLTLKVTMRELPRKSAASGVYTRVVTNNRTYHLEVVRYPGVGKDAMLYTGRGKVIECDGLTHNRHEKKRAVSFSVPRRCLGNPRWVRLGTAVFHMRHGTKSFLDESHQEGWDDSPYLEVGPKIRR